jgi:hypothetical protein
LAKQSLPTADVRLHRNMSDNDRCHVFGAQDSWKHSLIECNMARNVWALVDENIVEHVCRSRSGFHL